MQFPTGSLALPIAGSSRSPKVVSRHGTRGLLVDGLDGGHVGPVPIDVGVVEGVRTTGSVGISH